MSAEQYLDELHQEKELLDPREFQHAIRLIESEINNVGSNNDESYQDTSAAPKQDKKYDEEIVIVSEKIILPIEDYPRFNFVGRLLGTKGQTMKSLQESTKTRISILGKGSTRDREKEEELSESGDPKNDHFKEPLHIIVSAKAPRSVAHERIANCLSEINKCLDEGNAKSEEHMNRYDMRRQDFRGGIGAAGMPMIKVGIPPPGAFILNPAPHTGNGKPRGGGRGGHGGRGRGRGRGEGRSRPY